MKWMLLLLALVLEGCWGQEEAEEKWQIGAVNCEYNSLMYNVGDSMPTKHLCLDCKCTPEFQEASDRYCEVIKCDDDVTDKLNMGCMPIYNETECCPIGWNCDQLKEEAKKCECDERYFKHYEVKGCSPMYEEDCDKCPSRFNCPAANETQTEDNTVCLYKGRTYQPQESIDIGNPCRICQCLPSYSGTGMEINCISIECPSLFGAPLNESCREIHEFGKCCSVRTECSTDEVSARSAKVCTYKDKTYHLGQNIYPDEDPCLICTCSEDWTGINGSSCYIHDCALELKRKYLEDGCLPIYHESTCCPIEFYCGTLAEGFLNTTVPLASKADIDSKKSCMFKGSYYKLGQILDINHPTGCVTCTCSTPPDFTCIHKLCPGPPNGDYENCISSYERGQCCATYSCPPLAGSAPVPECSPVDCPKDCSEVTVHNSCPFCMCNDILCSPPVCSFGCEVQKEVPPNKCPGCDCPSFLAVMPICTPVKCDSHCYEVVNPNGCPMCICGPLCSTPKCEPGCELVKVIPEGECPRCICPIKDGEMDTKSNIQCSPVKCLPGCAEVTAESGCPSCNCGIMCSPPNCGPGCQVDPAPKGPCPGCVCGDDKILQEPMCSPVKCGPLCHEAYDGSKCPTCICDPKCSTPKCEVGCHLEYNSAMGPCPECVCNRHKNCPKITCGTLCREAMGVDGCSTCFCDPQCSPPSCQAGCHLEYDRSAGPCPACICLNEQVISIQCAPVKCEAGCIEAIGQDHCPICVCNPQCSAPKCEPGCEILYRSEEPCPECYCEPLSDIVCSPPLCDPGCTIDYTTKPCPGCRCGNTISITQLGIPLIQCSPPKCDAGCRINPNTKPCPSCDCDLTTDGILCTPPKCDIGCTIDNDMKPCPGCHCGGGLRIGQIGIPLIQCSPPKCDANCRIDPDTKPCPSCACDPVFPVIMCSPPKCDADCSINYDTKPCPSCKCGDILSTILCSPPKCAPGCKINYDTEPCPSCSCSNVESGVQCSPVKCERNCHEVIGQNGCPDCECPKVLCSIPFCDPGCRIDYTALPCPTCVCDRYLRRFAATRQLNVFSDPYCSQLKCGPRCRFETVQSSSSERCPMCECEGRVGEKLTCGPMKCELPCRFERFSAYGCPTCICYPIPCSPVKCQPGYIEKKLPEERCPMCVPETSDSTSA